MLSAYDDQIFYILFFGDSGGKSTEYKYSNTSKSIKYKCIDYKKYFKVSKVKVLHMQNGPCQYYIIEFIMFIINWHFNM